MFPNPNRLIRSVFTIGSRRFGFTVEEHSHAINVYDMNAMIERDIANLAAPQVNERSQDDIDTEFSLSVPATVQTNILCRELFNAFDEQANELIKDCILQQIAEEILQAFWDEVNPYLESPVASRPAC